MGDFRDSEERRSEMQSELDALEQAENEFDLYADDHEPMAKFAYSTYRVTIPGTHIKTHLVPFVYVEVDEYGLVNIERHYTRWFGDKLSHVDASKSTFEIEREIIDWLVEWELAEWRKIGPEDREVFATAKLTGEEQA